VKIAERSDSNFHDKRNYQVEAVVRFLTLDQLHNMELMN
jgi:hypothetical protein